MIVTRLIELYLIRDDDLTYSAFTSLKDCIKVL